MENTYHNIPVSEADNGIHKESLSLHSISSSDLTLKRNKTFRRNLHFPERTMKPGRNKNTFCKC